MRIQKINFNGAILERGFWLYVWKVKSGIKTVYYVGRTGDNSSRYAASPFNRLGQHLDVRPNATANSLLRNIQRAGLEPVKCKFELISVGPLFAEQITLRQHRKYRDIVAPLETALAGYLKKRGFKVIGNHPKPKRYNTRLYQRVIANLRPHL